MTSGRLSLSVFWTLLTCAAVGLLFSTSQSIAARDMPQVIDIGCQKQLFADDYIVEELDNVYRVMNRPIKYKGNPLIALNPDQRPGGKELIVVSGSVLFDEEEHIFKMWYEGATYYWNHNVVGYALSKDGIHWHLPNHFEDIIDIDWQCVMMWSEIKDWVFNVGCVARYRQNTYERLRLFKWEIVRNGIICNFNGND